MNRVILLLSHLLKWVWRIQIDNILVQLSPEHSLVGLCDEKNMTWFSAHENLHKSLEIGLILLKRFSNHNSISVMWVKHPPRQARTVDGSRKHIFVPLKITYQLFSIHCLEGFFELLFFKEGSTTQRFDHMTQIPHRIMNSLAIKFKTVVCHCENVAMFVSKWSVFKQELLEG